MRTVINSLLAQHSGHPLDTLEKDVERDFIMSAAQAKDYGLIDEIITKHR
jgi:ATP-dependent Clp protease protease subunit